MSLAELEGIIRAAGIAIPWEEPKQAKLEPMDDELFAEMQKAHGRTFVSMKELSAAAGQCVMNGWMKPVRHLELGQEGVQMTLDGAAVYAVELVRRSRESKHASA